MKKKLLTAVTVLLLAAALSVSAMAAESVGTLNKAPRSMDLESPYISQCELGSVVADAFRAAGETQIALINTSMLSADLPQGNITREDVEHVFSSDEKLVTATISPRELYALLENAVADITVDTKTERIITDNLERNQVFCQISGFSFRYDASAPVGERVLSLRLDDGTKLERTDSESRITVTAPEHLLDGDELSVTCADALCSYIAVHSELPEGDTDRITVLGARENTIVGMFPRWLLVAGIGILTVLLAMSGLRLKHHKEEFD